MNLTLVRTTTDKNRFPPGPRDRFPFEQLLYLHRDPLGYLTGLAREYGDIVHFRGGALHGYLVNHPDLIKEVLVTHNRVLPVGIWQRQARRLLGSGLITSEGDEHLRQRRMLQPSFHHSRIIALSRFSSDYTEAWCAEWRAGQVIETASEFWKLTLKIVAQSLFSTEIVNELQELLDVTEDVVELASPGALYFADALLRLPLPFTKKFDRARARLDATIYRIIAEHRAAAQENDLLGMLLDMRDENGAGMSDEELRDQTITLLTAGHGTTSIALMWAFYLLDQNPQAQAEFHREVDAVVGERLPTVQDLQNLPYTRAVLAEALRLYPPVYAQDREAAQEVEIGGYVIPKHSVVLTSQWVTQRDARFFPEPERFLPERWMGNERKLAERFYYFPFGVGPRVCIGEEYAWMNGMLIMATLARRWHLQLVPGHRIELFARSGLGSRHGMKMSCEPRSRDVTGF